MKELMKWLSPIEPQKRHQDILQKRLKDTGQWFTKGDGFINWRGLEDDVAVSSDGGQVFGCYGKPGAGKSIIW
jgi:ABC-type Na+ transport system ATPase subunit NatA